MALAKPFGIASIIGGIALLLLAFAVGTGSSTAFAGEDETPTVENGDTTGTPANGDTTGTPANGDTTGTPDDATTPTSGAGGISTPTPSGGGAGDATTPPAGGTVTVPDTGTGPGSSGTDASLLWLLGAGSLVIGAGAVLYGTRQRS
jgi:hypothetical protein